MNAKFIAMGLVFGLVLHGAASRAGECRVSSPSLEMIHDADMMDTQSDFELERLKQEYIKLTGQEPKVVLVGRVGQSLQDQLLLQGSRGSKTTLEQLVKSVEREPAVQYSGQEGGGRNRRDLVRELLKERYQERSDILDASHLGFFIRNHPLAQKYEATGEYQEWIVEHMLRPCKDDNPAPEFAELQLNRDMPRLWVQGTMMFFADDPVRLAAYYYVPAPELQDALYQILTDAPRINQMKADIYNAAAGWRNVLPKPGGQARQESNSNQWVLEVLAAAYRKAKGVEVFTRADAQLALFETDYRPSNLLTSGSKALGYLPFASKLVPEFRYYYDEQPFYSSYGVAEIVTVNSVRDYLARNRWLTLESKLEGPPKSQPGSIKILTPEEAAVQEAAGVKVRDRRQKLENGQP